MGEEEEKEEERRGSVRKQNKTKQKTHTAQTQWMDLYFRGQFRDHLMLAKFPRAKNDSFLYNNLTNEHTFLKGQVSIYENY